MKLSEYLKKAKAKIQDPTNWCNEPQRASWWTAQEKLLADLKEANI